MPATADEVFTLLHDYGRRLEWDTLLKEARLTRGCSVAEQGATSLCVGKPFFGLIGMETRYVTFNRGVIAAVKLINHPPFFTQFAASIRHEDNGAGSTATYQFRFEAKPRVLGWLLEPVMLWALKRETAKRLEALARFLGAA
ncbi:MAG: hypothetical protein ACI8XO_002610 [Verrucomicrobiales bacterium]|mgnify:CR=1 FL=1|jgi:hypothetical protein